MSANQRKILKLLDAAFHELQHDTGPSDMEWRVGRTNLRDKFCAILGVEKFTEDYDEESELIP